MQDLYSAFGSGNFLDYIPSQKKSKGKGNNSELSSAFMSGDFLKHLNYSRKNTKNSSGFNIDTNFFNYIGGGGTGRDKKGHRYPRNAFEVDYTKYLHYGNEGLKSERRDDFLAYIPDIGSGRKESEERGIEGIARGFDRSEEYGVQGVQRVRGGVRKIKGHIKDQKILREQGYTNRLERRQEKNAAKKLLKERKRQEEESRESHEEARREKPASLEEYKKTKHQAVRPAQQPAQKSYQTEYKKEEEPVSFQEYQRRKNEQ